jgi:hypothetical protein
MAKLRDVEIDPYLKECVDMDLEVLSEEYARQSADYAYWNEKYKDALKAQLLAEFNEQQVEARLYLQNKQAPDGGKAPTEAAVDAKVKLAPEYAEARIHLIETQVEEKHVRGIMDALRTKKDMLTSAGATQRQELEGDMKMYERAQLKRAERG